jgi:hypothetical protein
MTDQPQSLERFDGAAAWATLMPDQQAEIGAIALEYMIAVTGRDAYRDIGGLDLLARPFEAAEALLLGQLYESIEDALAATVPALNDDVEFVPIPSRLGAVCRACACSEFDPCPEGCGWAESDLCTACVMASEGPLLAATSDDETVRANGR